MANSPLAITRLGPPATRARAGLDTSKACRTVQKTAGLAAGNWDLPGPFFSLLNQYVDPHHQAQRLSTRVTSVSGFWVPKTEPWITEVTFTHERGGPTIQLWFGSSGGGLPGVLN